MENIMQLKKKVDEAENELYRAIRSKVSTLSDKLEDVLAKLEEHDEYYSEYEFDFRIETDSSYSDYYNYVTVLDYKGGQMGVSKGVWDNGRMEFDSGIELPNDSGTAINLITYLEDELKRLEKYLKEFEENK
ncbi:MAG: hypothetical protein ACRC92_14600 [Peptostreptococcaceae bacterium]